MRYILCCQEARERLYKNDSSVVSVLFIYLVPNWYLQNYTFCIHFRMYIDVKLFFKNNTNQKKS